jgi:hypothetical protein
MSSSLGPAPAPPQSLLPHLDQLLRLLAAPADAAPPSTDAHQAEIAATAAAMRTHLAESTRWAGTLKGGDVAEDEVDEVIDVLTRRVREQRYGTLGICLPRRASHVADVSSFRRSYSLRRILETLEPSPHEADSQSQAVQAPAAFRPALQDESQDQEMRPANP